MIKMTSFLREPLFGSNREASAWRALFILEPPMKSGAVRYEVGN
jgi:hypothetical protein